jgi:Tol biopolymer transport system component
VAGVAGTPIASLNYVPVYNSQNEYLAYDNGGVGVYVYSMGLATQWPVQGTVLDASEPSFSHDGRVAFMGFDSSTGYFQIYTCYLDGSLLTKVTTTFVNHIEPSWSPNNQTLVFSNQATEEVETVPSGGGSETVLNNAYGEWPSYSPNGSLLVVQYDNTPGDINTYDIATQTVTNLTSGLDPSKITSTSPSWTPDGKSVLFSQRPEGSTGDENISEIDFNGLYENLTTANSGYYDHKAVSAPDERSFAFERDYENNTSAIFTSDFIANGNVNQLIGSTNSGGQPENPNWSPALANRLFVGKGGVLEPKASGFLFAQHGSMFTSIVAFGANTPSTAVITSQTPPETSTLLVFTISADEITSFAYANGYYLPAVQVTANAPQVLVSFDITSGQVTAVAPYVLDRGPIQKSLNGTSLIFTGRFQAVYDHAGKNLTPNGATRVTIDGKTGKLVGAE